MSEANKKRKQKKILDWIPSR